MKVVEDVMITSRVVIFTVQLDEVEKFFNFVPMEYLLEFPIK